LEQNNSNEEEAHQNVDDNNEVEKNVHDF
jgi:hypothetical protein